MNENDLIAEYVKERYPYLLNTIDFAVYRFGKAAQKMGQCLRECLIGIEKSEFAKLRDEQEAQEGENHGI